jgi:hypothetical protein
MQQQQQPNIVEDFKRNFNIGCTILTIWQRAIIVPMRNQFGVESLGLICLMSFCLMAVWAAWSGDQFMWGYLALWTVCLLRRRFEASRLAVRGEKVHSRSEGWPQAAMRVPFVRTPETAILIVEPLFTFAYGVGFWFLAREIGTPPGLAYFLMGGALAMRSVASIQQKIFQRRTQAILDARLEQEAVMENYRGKWGNS